MFKIKESLNTLPSCNNNQSFIIKTTWDEEFIAFQLIIYTNSILTVQLQGNLSITVLKTSANNLEIPIEEFLFETQTALCTNDGLKNFLYSWEEPMFIWRKRKESGLKLLYGSVELNSRIELERDLLFHAIHINVEQRKVVDKLTAEQNHFHKEYEKFRKSYEQCIAQKNTIETDLMKKFLALLNSKKDKINELEEQIKKVQDKIQVDRKDDNQLNDEDYDTDDSENKFHFSQPMAEKPSVKNLLAVDDLDDEPLTLTLPKRKKPNMNTGDSQPVDKNVGCNEPKQSQSMSDSSQESSKSVYECNTEQLWNNMK